MRAALALIALLAASPALAAETPAQDAPVATAGAQGAPQSVADQIDEYLRTSPAAALPAGGDTTTTQAMARDDRKPHGEVSVGVGTHGYRSVYARTDLPIGETGRLSLAFGDSRGPALWHDGQRCGLEGLTPQRPLDIEDGPNGRCVRPVPAW
jgi:hypothetical protein